MFRPFSNRPFIKKFFISYLIVLLIPIFLNLVIFRVSLRSVEAYARKSNTALINQIRYSLDFQFGNLENLVYQVSQNRKLDVLSKLYKEENAGFFYEMNEAVKEIQSYMMLENNIANDFYLIFTKSQTVANGRTIFTYDDFFGTRFQYSDWDEAKWSEFLTGRYHEYTFLKSAPLFNGIENFEGVIFVKTVPFFFNSDNSVFLVFTIRKSDLFAHYYPDYLNWKGSPVLYNSTSFDVLAEEKQSPEPNSISIEARSEQYDITYGLNVPYEDAFQELKRNRSVIILVNILIILLSFVAAYFLSRANANPLYQLYNKLKESVHSSDETRNGYDLISGSVTRLIDDKLLLENNLNEQKDRLRKEFLFRLVKYGFDTPAEMETIRKYSEMILPEGYSGILLMNLIDESISDRTSLKLSLIELMGKISPDSGLWMNIDETHLGYIYISSQKNRETWYEGVHAKIDKFNTLINTLIDFSYFWTVGNPVDRFFHLNTSYRQAKIISDEQIDFDNAACYEYRESLSGSTRFNFPIDIVQKLQNLVKAGDADMALDIFRQNWNENMHELSLSRRCKQVYFLELRSFLTRIDPGFADHTEFFDFHLNAEDVVFSTVSGGIERISSQVKTGKDRVHAELKEQLMQYLKDNYTDQNITLCSIATEFKKSESYISHIYKKYCGINFYTQLEGLRMDKAKELLKNTDLPIKDVAERSGYSTMHSFRRAFKKINGVSPSAYRTVT